MRYFRLLVQRVSFTVLFDNQRHNDGAAKDGTFGEELIIGVKSFNESCLKWIQATVNRRPNGHS